MTDYLSQASSGNVRIHRSTTAYYRCEFCHTRTNLGALYVAYRGITDDRVSCTSYFHLACFGACLELTESGENFAQADWWDAHEVRAATPDFYATAQFVAAYFAFKAEYCDVKHGSGGAA